MWTAPASLTCSGVRDVAGVGARLDGLERQAERLDATAAPHTGAAIFEAQDGRALRPLLEALHEPQWPPWPPEMDGQHHAWVAEHWTPEAITEWDSTAVALSDAMFAAVAMLAAELAAGTSTAAAFAEAHLEPPPRGVAPRDHVAARWPAWADTFDRRTVGEQYAAATWPDAPLAERREQIRQSLAEAERRLEAPTDAEREALLARRGVGIAGTGHEWRHT